MLIRAAHAEDAGEIGRVLREAFDSVVPETTISRWVEEVTQKPGNWRVMVLGNEIVGAVRVQRDSLRIGDAVIIKGDVGEVSILPQYQGRGYGTEFMKSIVEWMERNNFDIARLGGLVRFYSRFGWRRFPRRWLEFHFRPERAGASIVEPSPIDIPADVRAKITAFNMETDWPACKDIKERFDRDYMGSLACPVPSLGTTSLVFREQDSILGYISATISRADRREGGSEDEMNITDVAYEKDRPDVLEYLMASMLNVAYEEGIRKAVARIPFDQEFLRVISKIPIYFTCIENYGGRASNMLQIINLRSFLEHLIPELERRLKSSIFSDWEGYLGIDIGKERVNLSIGNGRVTIGNSNSMESFILAIDEVFLLKMVLGLASFEEVKPYLMVDIPVREAAVLNVLFPKRIAYSGNWG